jgi:hypothetical protein
MSDSLSDTKLGHMVSKMWSDYVRGLILLEEFNLEVFALMAEARRESIDV